MINLGGPLSYSLSLFHSYNSFIEVGADLSWQAYYKLTFPSSAQSVLPSALLPVPTLIRHVPYKGSCHLCHKLATPGSSLSSPITLQALLLYTKHHLLPPKGSAGCRRIHKRGKRARSLEGTDKSQTRIWIPCPRVQGKNINPRCKSCNITGTFIRKVGVCVTFWKITH